MNKKVLSALLAAAVVLSLCACGKKAETPASTESETPAPTTASQENAGRELSLTEVSFSVTTWSSPNGATVNLTAVPNEHAKGDSAEFVVRLDADTVASVPCEWKDDAPTQQDKAHGADQAKDEIGQVATAWAA